MDKTKVNYFNFFSGVKRIGRGLGLQTLFKNTCSESLPPNSNLTEVCHTCMSLHLFKQMATI